MPFHRSDKQVITRVEDLLLWRVSWRHHWLKVLHIRSSFSVALTSHESITGRNYWTTSSDKWFFRDCYILRIWNIVLFLCTFLVYCIPVSFLNVVAISLSFRHTPISMYSRKVSLLNLLMGSLILTVCDLLSQSIPIMPFRVGQFYSQQLSNLFEIVLLSGPLRSLGSTATAIFYGFW